MTQRYDRIARIYDACEAPMDWLGSRRRRRRILAGARGAVLEVGIGTGRNLEHYPPGIELTGIDVSERMLDRARRRAARLGLQARLIHADVRALPFPDSSFDTVAGTCVFCSVAEPAQGLAEVARAVRPDGLVLLLEHVRPTTPLLGLLADLVSPLASRLLGPALNRRTEETVARCGLEIVEFRREGIWREIVARRRPATA